MQNTKWANNTANITGEYDPHWSYSNFSGGFLNADGVAAGYEKYAAGGADPYQEPREDYGNFWKKVFPMGSSDCQLQAAIDNITAKLAELDTFNNGQGHGLTWAVQNMDIGAYSHIKKPDGYGGDTQGNAYQYVSKSRGTLSTILQEYKAAYSIRVSKGGGCIDGMQAQDYYAKQRTMAQLEADLTAQKEAMRLAAEAAAEKAASAKKLAQGAASGAALGGATTGLPLTIMFVAGGALLLGVVGFILFKKKTKTGAQAIATS